MDANLSGTPVAVIGATGFIGSHLCERLAALGARVLAISRSSARLASISSVTGDVEFQALDILDSAGLTSSLRSFAPKKVFHLAGCPDAAESFEQMTRVFTENTLGTINVMQASVECGADTVVFADTSKVFGNTVEPYTVYTPYLPECSYAMAKSAAWDVCKLVSSLHPHLSVVSLRPTLVYGPRQSWNLITYVKQCAEAKRTVILQGGSQTRDPLYVEDAVEAFVLASVCPAARNLAIPIGGGHEITVAEMCAEILSVLRSDSEIVVGGQAPRPTEIWRSHCSNADASRILGWVPRTSFNTGLHKSFGAVHADTVTSNKSAAWKAVSAGR